MKKIFSHIITTLILFLAITSCSRSNYQKDSQKQNSNQTARALKNYPPANIKADQLKNGKLTTVAGRLRLVGSARFSKLVLTPLSNFDIELQVSKAEKKMRLPHTGKFVEVQGILTIKKMLAPGGKFLHNRYQISVQKISLLQKK